MAAKPMQSAKVAQKDIEILGQGRTTPLAKRALLIELAFARSSHALRIGGWRSHGKLAA